MRIVKKSLGFTLVELIVVIAIIGVLSAVLIPAISGYVKDAKVSADEQEARAIYNVYKNFQLETENGQPSKGFLEYYKEITGKDLSPMEKRNPKDPDINFWFCTENSGQYTCLWPHAVNELNDEAMGLTEVFIYKGHYYTVIDVDTGAMKTGLTNVPGLFE